MENDVSMNRVIKIVSGVVISIIVFSALLSFVSPIYKVWKAEKTGEAEYAQAEQNRKITILEAQAFMESATLKAEAEIERAKGVAEANKIIAGSLQGNESYLRYLWIDKLSDNPNVIYVPTEASLPLLEAGRLK